MCNCSHHHKPETSEQPHPLPQDNAADLPVAETQETQDNADDAARAEFEALAAAPNLAELSDDDKKAIEAQLLGKEYIEDADCLTIDAETQFTADDLPRFFRVFRSKNEPMTMDYCPWRINIWLDSDGKCESFMWV
ncbi:hypothetical protein H4R19_002356 [Coemansia spiralis]|nr:hypothetical protein H4R19_002356 [Coemansia spiralis]